MGKQEGDRWAGVPRQQERANSSGGCSATALIMHKHFPNNTYSYDSCFFFFAFWMEFFVLAHQDANFIQEAEIYKCKNKKKKRKKFGSFKGREELLTFDPCFLFFGY